MTLREIMRSAFGKPQDLPAAAALKRDSEVASAVPLRASKPNEGEFRLTLAQAVAGDVAARRKVGILYYRGFGVRPNPPQAVKWLTLAAEQGDPKADEYLGLMQQAMTPDEIANGQRLLARFKGQPERDFSEEDVTFESPEEDDERRREIAAAERDDRWVPDDEFDEERELLSSTATTGGPAVAGKAPEPIWRLPAEPAAEELNPPPHGPGIVQVVVWVSAAVIAMVAVGAGIFWLVENPIQDPEPVSQPTAVTMSMPMPRPPEPSAPGGDRTSNEPGAAVTPATAVIPVPKPTTANAEIDRLFAEANGGNLRAQFLAGLALAEGKLMPVNLSEAKQWFTIAAGRGHADAQNNLAIFYIRGLGVPKDLVEAYKWVALAHAGGNRDAGPNKDRLEKLLKPEELSRAQQQVAAFVPKP